MKRTVRVNFDIAVECGHGVSDEELLAAARAAMQEDGLSHYINADSGEETGSCDGRTLSDMLSALSKEAFARAKTALRRLGGTVTLENPLSLHIDTCNDSGFLFTLEAGTVRLSGDMVEVFAEGADIERIKSDPDSAGPDEYWCEGGEWYAEWDGLLELFDKIIEKSEKNQNDQ